MKQPNTICKNRDCHRGADGGRKHYYACRYCTHSENWRAVACCPECYTAFLKQVEEARAKGKEADTVPERTDMTRTEVLELINALPEQVITETELELAEELEAALYWGFGDIVDQINLELDASVEKKEEGDV